MKWTSLPDSRELTTLLYLHLLLHYGTKGKRCVFVLGGPSNIGSLGCLEFSHITQAKEKPKDNHLRLAEMPTV